ncbi:MAG: diguanylate cyclase [Rubripirellula sp.]
MLKTCFGSARLAVALVLIGLSLLIGGMWLGMVPTETEASAGARIRLLGFFIIGGMFAYTLFVSRIMSSFEVTQVLPDRVRHSLDALAEGLLVMDENERIILANESFRQMTGMSRERLVGRRAGSLAWECSESATEDDFPWTRALAESTPQTEQLLQFRNSDGTFRILSVNSSPVDSTHTELRGVLSTFRDITQSEGHRAALEHRLAIMRTSHDEVHSKNRELEVLATRDAMTGCLNRRAFFEHLESLWRDLVPQGGEMACLMVDCDRFKEVNDQHGHHVGDEVLRVVSDVLAEVFELPSLVCRYGGEEFCVLMPHHWTASAALDAEVVRQSIEDLRLEDYPSLRLSVSIGISDLRFRATGPQELVNQADQCLYIAKRNGRNQVVAYTESIADLASLESRNQGHSDLADIPFPAVRALVSALAYRDSATAEHSRRVADLCVRIGSGLLDQRSVYLLEVAALLHDVGKIGVPDNVLLKPSALSETEWVLMRQHERIGLEIASCACSCDEINEILRTHRAGYQQRPSEPHLPTGNDIPLTARLLTLADSYDAMVSQRAYRMTRTHDQAIQELRRCAGTQFDPVLVEHFAATVCESDILRWETDDGLMRQTALQFGLQIGRIAEALDARDAEGVRRLAARLLTVAQQHHIDSIAIAAQKIESDVARGDVQWMTLLHDTQQLLNLCRAKQSALLIHQAKSISKFDLTN